MLIKSLVFLIKLFNNTITMIYFITFENVLKNFIYINKSSIFTIEEFRSKY